MNQAVKDPEILEALYWHEDLDMWQIAERLNCSETTVWRYMSQYGIDRRSGGKSNKRHSQALPYRMHKRGYPAWTGHGEHDGMSTVYVHQLLAIADGAEPEKVFSNGKWHVHHKNKIPFDNRPENLEVMAASDHQKMHKDRGDGHDIGELNKYEDGELIEWLHSFVAEFGYVPKSSHIKSWPGPSLNTYIRHFESWQGALEAAGLDEDSLAAEAGQ